MNYKNMGLINKYVIQHTDNSPIDPGAKYFVLRYDGNTNWAFSCRVALLTLVESIKKDLPILAEELFQIIIEEGKRNES